MGTSLCDVTVTLKHQGKIVNIFFFQKKDTFSTRKCMLCTFTKNAHGITQRHTLYYEAVDYSLFYYLVIHRTILGTGRSHKSCRQY